jgi:MoxR-like ATPase
MEPSLASLDTERHAAVARGIAANIASAVEIPPSVSEQLAVVLLAEGHVLIEGFPGVGKTTLARALARSLDCRMARVQCSPDLMPADVVGVNVYDQREHTFAFRPGPIFANVVLVDEINRASPKAQSGLLECMQERRVTVDGQSHDLASPFIVVATQNPAEYEGTYALAEAQVDRFMLRIVLRYQDRRVEAAMLAANESGDAGAELEPVADAADLLDAQAAARRLYASPALHEYIVALLWQTREDPRVALGASPRAGLMLLRAAKALALLRGRDHALPDDVQELAEPVLAHRLVLAAQAYNTTAAAVVADALARTTAR